jgi:hypothetical protein
LSYLSLRPHDLPIPGQYSLDIFRLDDLHKYFVPQLYSLDWPPQKSLIFFPCASKQANPPPAKMSTNTSSLQQLNPNPTTPAFADDLEWITEYLEVHVLSRTTWRYACLLWLTIGPISLTFAVCHLLGLRSGTLGAYWSKWTFRRQTWRKKHSLAQAEKNCQPHKQPVLLPSNAQLLSLTSLTILSLALTFLGLD